MKGARREAKGKVPKAKNALIDPLEQKISANTINIQKHFFPPPHPKNKKFRPYGGIPAAFFCAGCLSPLLA